MGLTRLAVKRPLTMLMIILGLVILGVRGFTLMQVERYPKVDFPFISVVVVFPGASPDDVETLVVKPIEDAVAGIPGIDYVQSVSNEGFGYVVAAFQEGVDGDQAAIDVERKVSAIKGTLPSDATDPSVIKADINAIPIMSIILSGSQNQDELFKLADDEVRPLLQSVKGVASVSVAGGRNKIISVQVDGKKLSAYKLPITSLSQAFATGNMAFPVGSLEDGRQKSTLRSVGSFQSLAEVERMAVSGAPSSMGGSSGGSQTKAGADPGGLVYLKDLATVDASFEDVVGFQRYNGQDTVSISVIPTSGANVIEVANGIARKVESLNQTLPGNAKLTVISDDSKFIKSSVASVEEDLVLAVLITGLVMLVFLHTLRSTFIVIMAIPTSLFATFLVMWALGYSINVLTLLAMTLIIGILVDDSIVVLENIERHLKMRKAPKQAAIDGRQEIGWAAIAITLVDVVVYIPVAFTSGIVGQFFRAYGITIVTATLFSLLISFTLTPMLAAYFMKEKDDKLETRGGVGKFLNIIFFPVLWFWNNFTRLWEAGFDALSNFYGKVIGLSLRNIFTQGLVILIALAVFVGALFFNQFEIPMGNYKIKGLGLVSSEFMPQEDDGKFKVTIQMPPGTALNVTDQVTRQIEQTILREVPETVSILSSVGSSGSSSGAMSSVTGGSNSASISVLVVGKNDRARTLSQIVNELRPAVTNIPDAHVTVTMSSFMSMGTAAISVQVYGADPDVLIDLSKQVEAVVRNTPNTIDVLNLDAVRAPETKIRLNRQRLSDLGISPASVTGALRTAVTGSDVGDFAPEGEEKIQITLRLDENSRENLENLLQLPIGYLNSKPILLSQVAEIERSLTPAVIKRYDRQRILTISSGVIGSNSSGVTDEIEARIKQQVVFPPEYGYRFTGMSEAQRESFADLFSALLLSIILIYMLLVALYQNFLQPLAIMFSLPLALIGVMGGLAATHNSLNMFSMLGVIMLAGIVGRNSILLVDFANQLRERGVPRKQALVEAGRLRLRPIIMTSFALIFALLPVLFGAAEGSESRQPLAAVLVGGSATSGLLSLLVTPVTYNILEGLTDRVKSLFYLIVGREVEKVVTPPAADSAGEA